MHLSWKVGLTQTQFMLSTPQFMLSEPYSSLFFYLDPLKWAQFIYIIFSFKKIRRKNIWCSGLCPVLLLLRSFWCLVGPCLGCWDDWPNCEVFVVSLFICLSIWVVSSSQVQNPVCNKLTSPSNLHRVFPQRLLFNLIWCRLSDILLKRYIACLSQFHEKIPSSLQWTHLSEPWASSSGVILLGRVWVTFQCFNFVLSSFL